MIEKLLIVNADDYGLTKNVSKGIREAHINGIVTSTTAMMNMEPAEEELLIAHKETPSLGIGVHLTLTAGKSVLPMSEVNTLIDESGQFFNLQEIKHALPSIEPSQVYREWKAQIDRMYDLGIEPDHLDSHHHVSYKFSIFFQIMLKLAQEYQLPIRSASVYKPTDRKKSDINLDKALLSPDHLETRFYGAAISIQLLRMIVQELEVGITELMTHPGLSDSDLEAVSSYTSVRENELTLLTSQETKDILESSQVKLTTFEAVQKS